VSSVKAKTISCACHGSSFSAADGSVLTGPATRPLDEIKVKVEGDKIVKA
jgi:Rieske Fe-S protein